MLKIAVEAEERRCAALMVWWGGESIEDGESPRLSLAVAELAAAELANMAEI